MPKCDSLIYCYRCNICCRLGVRFYCDNPDLDKPVKFTTSKAAQWRAEFSRSGKETDDDMPDAQPFIVVFSVAIFLYYFMFFREESDIDELFDLNKSIYDKIDGLEEIQLRILLKRKMENNEDVTDIEKRLMELIEGRLANKLNDFTPAL